MACHGLCEVSYGSLPTPREHVHDVRRTRQPSPQEFLSRKADAMFAFSFRYWPAFTSMICLCAAVFCSGDRMHAQSGNRNASQQYRKPGGPVPNSTPRRLSSPSTPQSFPGTDIPRTRSRPTSPRLDQFRTLQQPSSAPNQPNRRELSRRRPLRSIPIPATGLNPTLNVAPDTRFIPNVRYPHSNQNGRWDRDEEVPTGGALDFGEDISVNFDSDDDNLPVRRWMDNTGTFSTVGRLVAVLGGKVRLLKENGRTTTVPARRLSKDDRKYVEEQLAVVDDRQSL